MRFLFFAAMRSAACLPGTPASTLISGPQQRYARQP
jgi:hypothetical protein